MCGCKIRNNTPNIKPRNLKGKIMTALLNEYKEIQEYLLDIENQKLQIELNSFDYDSKETIIKMTSKLMKEHEAYKELCYRIELYKTKLAIVDKKLSMIKSVAHMFTHMHELENYTSQLQ